MRIHDLVIVGAGPAGIGAAIQADHCGLDVLVLEKQGIGGKLALARKVHNFPLIGGGLSGEALAEKLGTQLRRRGVPLEFAKCESVKKRDDVFFLRTAKAEYPAKSVALATGGTPIIPSIEGLGGLVLKNRAFLSWTSILERGVGRVVVIGGGEIGFDSACSLLERGCDVTVLMRSREPAAYPALVHKAASLGVKMHCGVDYKKFCLTGDAVSVRYGVQDRLLEESFEAVLICAGSRAGLSPSVKIEGTANHGVFYAGDATGTRFRQAVIAFGDGVRAAMKAIRYLNKELTC